MHNVHAMINCHGTLEGNKDKKYIHQRLVNNWSMLSIGPLVQVKFNVEIFSAIYGGFFLYYSTTFMWINFVWGKKICTAIKLFAQNVELINVLTKVKENKKSK